MLTYEQTIIKIVEKVLPAVVSVAVSKELEELSEQLLSESYRLGIPINPEEIESRLEQVP